MNLLLIFRPIDTSEFVDSRFRADKETQDPYLSLLGANKKKKKKLKKKRSDRLDRE